MEIFFTILSGVLVFIISQFFLKLVIEPLVLHLRIISKVLNRLKFYENIIVNPPFKGTLPQNYLEAKNILRKLSCDLEVSYKAILFKKIFIKMKIIRDEMYIQKVSQNLIWLSNATGNRDETGIVNVPLMAADKIDEIRKYLESDIDRKLN